jgi:hypothetical protein
MPLENHNGPTTKTVKWVDMDDLTLDRLIVDTLVEDYDWDEEQAEEAVAAWRDSGSDEGWDVAAIAESIDRASEDED